MMATTTRPQSPFLDQKIDHDIKELVDALSSTGSDIVTLGSCCGHGEGAAYVDVAVRGMHGLRRLVRIMNRVDEEMKDTLLLDVGVNWSEEIATACDFENHPEWIMLSLSIQGDEDEAPSRQALARLGEIYRREAARELCIGS